ncbi:META domain-containing protein [uncultured Neisseria sp.]|uniref:META domain-containing protein n=1 Tax=uncultured Neisseria sp. TaxID=237778 RepID=UPI0025D3DAF8|nr:META domain-containing protein [uncultured Neisseria sp.]
MYTKEEWRGFGIKFISVLIGAFVLAACSTPTDKPLSSQPHISSSKSSESQQMKMPTLAAKWRVVAFNKFTEKELADKNAYLDFSEMPKAHGNMGCNGMMFQVNVIGADKVDFGPIAATRMLCEDMKLENAFLRKQSVWNYRFDGNDLILEQKGISIRLRRE